MTPHDFFWKNRSTFIRWSQIVFPRPQDQLNLENMPWINGNACPLRQTFRDCGGWGNPPPSKFCACVLAQAKFLTQSPGFKNRKAVYDFWIPFDSLSNWEQTKTLLADGIRLFRRGMRESNPRQGIWRPLWYHFTNPPSGNFQFPMAPIVERFAFTTWQAIFNKLIITSSFLCAPYVSGTTYNISSIRFSAQPSFYSCWSSNSGVCILCIGA